MEPGLVSVRLHSADRMGEVMSEKKNGGMAFPDPGRGQSMKQREFLESGMTLCDYFAAKAMQELLGVPAWPDPIDYPEIARRAYAIADCMLAERAK